MRIAHDAYLFSEMQLQAAIDDWQPGHMIFLIGPSGVGKTTLRHQVMRATFGQPEHWGKGRVPVIEIFAALTKNAHYSSKDFAIKFASQLRSPSLKWLVDGDPTAEASLAKYLEDIEYARDVWTRLLKPTQNEGQHWADVSNLLRARQCRYVFIDQATALLFNHANLEPAQHTTHLMTLAEEAGIMIVMIGVPEATRLWDVHYELRRRVLPIWMAPYSLEDQVACRSFMRLLLTLETVFEVERANLLLTLLDEIMAATGGIFGEVVHLLKRAKFACRSRGKTAIAKHDILASVYNEADLRTLWRGVDEFNVARSNADEKTLMAYAAESKRRKGSSWRPGA